MQKAVGFNSYRSSQAVHLQRYVDSHRVQIDVTDPEVRGQEQYAQMCWAMNMIGKATGVIAIAAVLVMAGYWFGRWMGWW